MARKRDSQGRFTSESGGILGSLSDRSLSDLAGLRDWYERNWSQANDAARAKGGAGTNNLDDQAREFASKQRKVTAEIYDRLWRIHLGRSKRARVADDSKSAKLTRNPVRWVRNKNRLDYPGVDTKDK